jgi:hypothetical protein
MHKRAGYFTRRKILKNVNFLDLTPIRNYDHELDEDELVVVLIPRFTGFLGSRILQPHLKHPYMKMSLDELGSATWMLSDGKHTVRQICKELKQKFGDKIHPAEDRVTRFLSQLYLKKLILFNEILKK